MTYPSYEPQVVRLYPFQSEGGALAAVDVTFGPVCISAKLYQREDQSYFLSLPSRKSEARDKWYDQVSISDRHLFKLAESKAVAEFHRVSRSEAVAV